MMVLAKHQQISYHTINNFRSSDHTNELVKKSFLYFANLLEAEDLINEGAFFIDGTKIEADANRYTFVWRKSKCRPSQGLTELARETEAEIEKLTAEIAQEPKAFLVALLKKPEDAVLRSCFIS